MELCLLDTFLNNQYLKHSVANYSFHILSFLYI